jgi:protoporphyrinogen IX oxidase
VAVLNNLLLWVHLVALGLGMASGLGMSQVGPRMAAAAPDQKATWWPLVDTFSRLGVLALAAMIVTGGLLVWLKLGGGGLNGWFVAKMGLVALMAVTIGASHVGLSRLRRGDLSGLKLVAVGKFTSVAALGAMLAAVFAFN